MDCLYFPLTPRDRMTVLGRDAPNLSVSIPDAQRSLADFGNASKKPLVVCQLEAAMAGG